jgi:hypothetical protein
MNLEYVLFASHLVRIAHWIRLVKASLENPELLPDKRVSILEDYTSTRRSFRRGATSRAEIHGIIRYSDEFE